MNKYENYREIGLPWLKEIPNHWEINKVKRYSDNKKELNKGNKEKNVLSLTYKGVVKNHIDKPNGLVPKSYETYQKFKKDDLVFKLIDLENIKTSRVGIVNEDGIMSPAYIRLILTDRLFPKYAYYYFYKLYIEEVYNNLGAGVRSTMSVSNLQDMLIPVPSYFEQEHIANYLDWKIREIDKLIEIEKQQIEDIERLKKIMISQYYIELPIKRRIKTLIQSPLVYGINEAGKMNGKIRFVRITDIEKNGSLKKDGKQYINNCEKKYILEKGDILFARSGGTVGKTYIHQDISNNELMAFAGYLIRARFDVNLVNPEYIYYYTQSESYTEWKNSIFIQSTIQNISAEKYSNLEIPYCSLNIQNKIVDKIKQKLLEINKLKEKSLEKQLYLVNLKESIISEVVTGQLDVRNVKIPERE